MWWCTVHIPKNLHNISLELQVHTKQQERLLCRFYIQLTEILPNLIHLPEVDNNERLQCCNPSLDSVLPEIHRAERRCGSQSRPSWLWRRGIWSTVQTTSLGSLQGFTENMRNEPKLCHISLSVWPEWQIFHKGTQQSTRQTANVTF